MEDTSNEYRQQRIEAFVEGLNQLYEDTGLRIPGGVISVIDAFVKTNETVARVEYEEAQKMYKLVTKNEEAPSKTSKFKERARLLKR